MILIGHSEVSNLEIDFSEENKTLVSCAGVAIAVSLPTEGGQANVDLKLDNKKFVFLIKMNTSKVKRGVNTCLLRYFIRSGNFQQDFKCQLT